MRLIKDSAGRKSWHLTLAVPALIAGTVWFLVGGISVELTLPVVGPLKLVTATKSGSEYLLFVTPWLSALGWRDYLKKDSNAKPERSDAPVPDGREI